MSVVFSSNFDNNTDWTGYPSVPGIPNVGCDGGYAFACFNTLSVTKQLLSSIPDEGSIRFQLAALCAPGQEIFLGFVSDGITDPDLAHFNLQFFLEDNGSILLKCTRGNAFVSPGLFYSDPGTIPLDGTWHSIQVRFVITDTDVTLSLDVDNANVLFQVNTLVTTYTTNSWVQTGVHQVGFNDDGFDYPPPYTTMVVISNFEADNSSNHITYLPCSATTIDGTLTCFPIPPPPTTDGGVYALNTGSTADTYYSGSGTNTIKIP